MGKTNTNKKKAFKKVHTIEAKIASSQFFLRPGAINEGQAEGDTAKIGGARL